MVFMHEKLWFTHKISNYKDVLSKFTVSKGINLC